MSDVMCCGRCGNALKIVCPEHGAEYVPDRRANMVDDSPGIQLVAYSSKRATAAPPTVGVCAANTVVGPLLFTNHRPAAHHAEQVAEIVKSIKETSASVGFHQQEPDEVLQRPRRHRVKDRTTRPLREPKPGTLTHDILLALAAYGTTPMTPRQVASVVGRDARLVGVYLAQLAGEGRVTRLGRGEYGP